MTNRADRSSSSKASLRIDVWSDIACPWCFVGKRRLEAALAEFEHKDGVEVVWHAFELDPAAPRELPTDKSHAERLASKYGMSVAQAESRIASMTEMAKADGIAFRFDRARSGNTFDAHRVIHLAKELGKQDAMKERYLRAYLEEGERIGDPETLVRLAAEIGLDPEAVRSALGSDAHASAVRGDEAEAQELGIRGVPFFVFGGKYAVSGAQPKEVLGEVLEKSWAELSPELVAVEGADAEACGPDGCALPPSPAG